MTPTRTFLAISEGDIHRFIKLNVHRSANACCRIAPIDGRQLVLRKTDRSGGTVGECVCVNDAKRYLNQRTCKKNEHIVQRRVPYVNKALCRMDNMYDTCDEKNTTTNPTEYYKRLKLKIYS